MKKPFLLLLTVLFFFLSACGSQSANAEDPVTLTIACWIKDSPLTACVEAFNSCHSDYQIEIYEYYDETDDDYQSAMLRMRADLISDSNCDLIYLDSMDISALENAGILMDLLPLMQEEEAFSENDYYWNIWSQYERDGKLYEWIPSFELTGVWGSSGLLGDISNWTIDDYLALYEQTGKKIGNVQPTTLLFYMLLYTDNDLLDPDAGICNLNSDEFRRWLEYAQNFSVDEDALYMGWIGGFLPYLSWQVSYNGPICMVNIPDTQGSDICASAHFSFGISNKTDHVSACWNFLRLLMEDDLLSAVTLGTESIGFPMKRSVLQNQLSRAQLPSSDTDSLASGWGDAAIPLSSEDASRLLTQIETTRCTQKYLYALYDVLEEEIEAYFSGSKTAEAAMEQLQNRVSIYLSEQS